MNDKDKQIQHLQERMKMLEQSLEETHRLSVAGWTIIAGSIIAFLMIYFSN